MARSIVFMGSPWFVLPVVQVLYNHPEFRLDCVVTAPGRNRQRRRQSQSLPTAVAEWVMKLSSNHEQPTESSEAPQHPPRLLEPPDVNHPEVLAILSQLKPALIITAAYGQILGDECLRLPTYGVLNIHPSKLPAYRGATPVQTAIWNGDQHTAVSFVKSVRSVDAGAIVSQYPVTISATETTAQLLERTFVMASEHVVSAGEQVMRTDFQGTPQDDSLATYCMRFTKQSGLVTWEQAGEHIFNQYRALEPWPGCYTFYNNQRVKLHGLGLSQSSHHEPAAFSWNRELQQLTVGTSSVDLIITAVTIAAKPQMSGRDFWNMVHSQPTWPQQFSPPPNPRELNP